MFCCVLIPNFHQVLKFGNEIQISLIAAEAGGAVWGAPPEAQTELFNALIDSCTEAVELGSLDPKGPLLDFFGVPVKANDIFFLIGKIINIINNGEYQGY